MFNKLPKAAKGLLIASFAAVLPSMAQAERTSSITAGEMHATTCFQCHGPEGKYVQGNTIPPLAGYPADAMYQQLLSFKSGERPNTIMQRHVKGYSNDELKAIADYLGSLKP